MNTISLRLISLTFSIIGIFSLLLLIELLPPETVSDPLQLEENLDNQKLIIQGMVNEEINNRELKTLVLDGKIKLQCSNCKFHSYKNKNISAVVKVNHFSETTYLKVLTLKITP